MRFSPGLLLLLPLLSPLAHAELIDDVNDRGELRIALEATHPPFNFKEGDKLTGFEVELGEQLAKEMDVRPSFITTDDTDLLQGVESGKYDVAINHIAMTAELRDRFDFSESYNQAPDLAIPFQKGNPAFKASLDKALERVKADGRLKALSHKWLESDAQ
ncbi:MULTISPECIES: transporter substrate-binding domain-containing protein [Pseudomonas]|jgi:L-cystine transport system substrate-binding protein|uniref:Extracellular solute-binding protein, family 3 n=1 Tax=Pseudomonas rhodesiae TaxID=76760 RepID=A0A5C5NZA7_9PSED|nr:MULTISPECIES: transporter substrate-binding domain-containing protein [Pseudomonas]OXS23866.1 ABC transporter substrate-binding protein [Pseudomonas fluorescens]KAF6693452.1 transporter substrate-binding domain-containing protein [Pseudomonas sp. EKM23D]MBI6601243.1 transporter substrate-binding domain-containing protein [Pseudomonas sp. S4_EA_1b]MBI6626968.1 transporter substrate-binding domain-containing protein [Pseudomonas rhodesiae]MBX4137722.1 transporter substrate-binding domain-cont